MSAGRSLVVAWALWQGLEVWAGSGQTATRGPDTSEIVNNYDTKDQCLAVAASRRRIRNAIRRRHKGEEQIGIEVWACAPTGLSPEKEWFE